MPSPELPEPGADQVVRFPPSGGRTSGFLGIGLVLMIAGYLLVAEPGLASMRAALALAVLAVLFWVALVRPRVEVRPGTLVIRNMFRDAHVPLAAIDLVGVRQTLDVWVGDRRFTCIGIGHTLRDVRRMDKRREAAPAQPQGYPALVAARIESLAQAARYDGGDPGTVRHEWAWVEVGLLAVLVLGLLATLVVG